MKWLCERWEINKAFEYYLVYCDTIVITIEGI
jgi:hypothetical protein